MQVEAEWLTSEATQAVFSTLLDAGHEAFAVGGCVRDSLLGLRATDIDFATSALPDTVIELASKVGIRAIPTGIEHGTVTVVSSGVPFEVTTFRKDVTTDGRRATVAFTESVEQDARRRDFTINALYADRTGRVLDPVSGLPDLRDRRVRFIEDAAQRIREDYLRSLRFFRFHAWYGSPDEGFDPDALAAIAGNIDGLETLSRERVGAELIKLLSAPDPGPAVGGMRSTGVLTTVLPGADDKALGPLVHLEHLFNLSPDPIRRLSALNASNAPEALRLSRSQAKELQDLQSAKHLPPHEAAYRLGFDAARDGQLLVAATLGVEISPSILDEIEAADAERFPLKAADLMPELDGKELGDELKRLERLWIESVFSLSREQLVELVRRER